MAAILIQLALSVAIAIAVALAILAVEVVAGRTGYRTPVRIGLIAAFVASFAWLAIDDEWYLDWHFSVDSLRRSVSAPLGLFIQGFSVYGGYLIGKLAHRNHRVLAGIAIGIIISIGLMWGAANRETGTTEKSDFLPIIACLGLIGASLGIVLPQSTKRTRATKIDEEEAAVREKQRTDARAIEEAEEQEARERQRRAREKQAEKMKRILDDLDGL